MTFRFEQIDSWVKFSEVVPFDGWEKLTYPPIGERIFALVEEDQVGYYTSESEKYMPSVMELVYEGDAKWRLVDFDPETQEEYLQINTYSIVAWRPVGDKS